MRSHTWTSCVPVDINCIEIYGVESEIGRFGCYFKLIS